VNIITMSIGFSDGTQASTMESNKHKSKSEKKQKSVHGEKKRKRDLAEDAVKSKSKKHKTSKSTTDSPLLDPPSNISPFFIQTSSLYLPLAPVSQTYPVEGMCAEHLSPLILTYYPPFDGVVLSYSNPRLSERPYGNDGSEVLLHNIDEYAVSWSWVTAEFLLFRPEKGAWLEGYINLQNEGHLGVVCWNLFNASIERKRLPRDWKWRDVSQEDQTMGDAQAGETYAEDGAGYYVDGAGNKIEGTIKFRVKEIESSHDKERGFLSIEGTMLSVGEETELAQKEEVGTERTRDMAGKRLGGSKALGATSLGVPIEADDTENSGKHRHRY
jgi:DNA-directed RNA polymerase I subunit RPA43